MRSMMSLKRQTKWRSATADLITLRSYQCGEQKIYKEDVMSRVKEMMLRQQEESWEYDLGYEDWLNAHKVQEPSEADLEAMKEDSESQTFKNEILAKQKQQGKCTTMLSGAEVYKFDNKTGEVIVVGNAHDYYQVRETKIKAYNLLSKQDFVMINGVWEAKRDGLIKILSSLPISYHWEIKERAISDTAANVLGTLTVETGSTKRSADSMGICERSELKGNGGLHFMNARAETRALKRAIETLFGSIINYFVVNNLIPNQQQW